MGDFARSGAMSFMCLVVGITIGLLFGAEFGERRIRNEAANAGAGYWHSDPKTGEQEFVWGRAPGKDE